MKKIKKRWIFVIIGVIICAVAFLWSTLLYKVFSASDIKSEITGTLLGTIISAIVTVLLLQGQTEIEEGKDISLNVFGKKQEIYHKFIEELENITKDGKINIPSEDNPDKTDELQHLIYQLGLVQMHAQKNTAEKITQSVGDLLSTISLMHSNEKYKNELYSQLADNIFNIVSLLRNDLYTPDEKIIKKVEKENLDSALRASGAFDKELLSEKGRIDTLEKFLNLLIFQLKERDYIVTLHYKKDINGEVDKVVWQYITYKTERWMYLTAKKTDNLYLIFMFSPEGDLWYEIWHDENGTNKDKELTSLLKSVPRGINFLNIDNPDYKIFARLTYTRKNIYIQKIVEDLDSKVQEIIQSE